jgi:hypothetical protein
MGLQFGMRFLEEVNMNAYFEAIEQADEREAQSVAMKWAQEVDILKETVRRNLVIYARINLALKSLLAKYQANSLCVYCDEQPTDRKKVLGIDFTEYVPGTGKKGYLNESVPCWSYALLIDEGVPCFCKGDHQQLVSLSLLMGLSGEAGVMGDLYRATPPPEIERLIQENIVVQRHDLVPPSMGDRRKRVKLVDLHNRTVGCCNFMELKEGSPVTILNVNRAKSEWFYWTGEVLWTKRVPDGIAEEYSEEIDNCCQGIAVRVKNARRIQEVYAGIGGHQVLAHGDWTEHLELLGQVFNARVQNLDVA